jgi:sugar phosphate isomerase/epimerase
LSAQERQEVGRRFSDSGVELMGLGTTCEFHSIDPAELARNVELGRAWIKLAHDVGASGIKVRPNGLPREAPVERTLAQIGKALRELATYGADFGVEIRLEVHGKGTSLLPNIKTIMDAADHEGAVVCWNCNETDLAGEGLASNFALVKDRLGTIHIHDLVSTYPWRELFKLLREAGFDGWTLLEEGSTTADPIRVMKYYRLLWEEWAQGASDT